MYEPEPTEKETVSAFNYWNITIAAIEDIRATSVRPSRYETDTAASESEEEEPVALEEDPTPKQSVYAITNYREHTRFRARPTSRHSAHDTDRPIRPSLHGNPIANRARRLAVARRGRHLRRRRRDRRAHRVRHGLPIGRVYPSVVLRKRRVAGGRAVDGGDVYPRRVRDFGFAALTNISNQESEEEEEEQGIRTRSR